MNTTTKAGAFLKSARETVFPFVSGSWKSGAFVPSGSIVELTATMEGIWDRAGSLSNGFSRCSRPNKATFSNLRVARSVHLNNWLQVPPLQDPMGRRRNGDSAAPPFIAETG